MKRCKRVTGFTDYPFVEIGDIAGQQAPIRRITVLSYDQNKYARVRVEGYDLETEIKWGYIYGKRERLGGGHTINRRKLERMIPRS